ncbi:hypothetical protein GLOTRDRAFT_137712 [Gloeophyllum trabeum ATCC 11539]|uniref:Uncharacterized protein n=1 Tax=Gloeophyllum trabeum (strain ATCC 11539 / FP-39264 / Madison 617) TaxID=670483 RepID=S7QDG6_GLOTA|nr:uncharacterized protein GLOTRDRAFT_137712 [Gloeophyllum trabeum ATCC 11539]EPQ57372.1 hypothetical protein GLOTRDRAFT_137712 [Gloeophyllum trabeum ATCC 11539]
MSSLTDSADRLLQIGKSIRSTATSISTSSDRTPFTRAVLHTHLGDLIRDADPSEIGLFTLVQSRPLPDKEAAATGTAPKEIARVGFPGATPLRKPSAKYGIKMKEREPEPEVYAQAALKYLDRYQYIRPMPRARTQVVSLLDELTSVRESIEGLRAAAEQPAGSGPDEPPSSPKSMIAAEERRIQELHKQMAELKQQKESLLHQQVAPRTTRRAFPARPRPAPPPAPVPAAPPKADAQEEMFWNTPASRARTLHFTESLIMDESVDLGNVTTSFSSPLAGPASRASRHMVEEDEPEDEAEEEEEESPAVGEEQDHEEQPDSPEEPETETDQETVVLSKPPDEPPSPTRPPDTPASEIELVTETPSQPTPSGGTESVRKPKVRITTEVERIVAKIWATVGEMLMPGHPYNVSGSPKTNKPPRAKETIAHLQSLSSQTPDPASPSSASLSTFSPAHGPSTQQILTAALLLAVLSAPGLRMSLNQVKEVVASRAGPVDVGMGAPQRALYGLVAKRLIRIDRSTREQMVMFDV